MCYVVGSLLSLSQITGIGLCCYINFRFAINPMDRCGKPGEGKANPSVFIAIPSAPNYFDKRFKIRRSWEADVCSYSMAMRDLSNLFNWPEQVTGFLEQPLILCWQLLLQHHILFLKISTLNGLCAPKAHEQLCLEFFKKMRMVCFFFFF